MVNQDCSPGSMCPLRVTLWDRVLVHKANLKGIRNARQWGEIFDPDGQS